MKGIVLAGGAGSRMMPLTKVTNKCLLPVGRKPMIFYPIELLKTLGAKEILLVNGRERCGDFIELLGSGEELAVDLTYRVQERTGGIAQALGLAKNFVDKDNCAVILGDNIYEKVPKLKEINEGKAYVFLKQVKDPERFGCVEWNGRQIKRIIEKPKKAPSNHIVTGLYIYPSSVFEIIKTLKPSGRGELEITDVNNAFLEKGLLDWIEVKGEWTDAGTFESWFKANKLMMEPKK